MEFKHEQYHQIEHVPYPEPEFEAICPELPDLIHSLPPKEAMKSWAYELPATLKALHEKLEHEDFLNYDSYGPTLHQNPKPVGSEFHLPLIAPPAESKPSTLAGIVQLDIVATPDEDIAPAPAVPKKTAVKIPGVREELLAVGYGEDNVDAAQAGLERLAGALIETRGYVRVAPKFSELVGDKDRQNRFSYVSYGNSMGGEMTEHEGLKELKAFLESAGGVVARDMLENLTFIGEKEYAEGVAGLAAFWKSYLEGDPERQLCLMARVTQGGHIKSDKFLLDRILAHFSDEEIAKYKGRLLLSPNRLSAPADKARIVLLDDWSISGSQIHGAYNRATAEAPGKYLGSIEINLLVASGRRVRTGFKGMSESLSKPVPVRAYYLTRDAGTPVEYKENGAYVSGTHSSVDFDFLNPLSVMSNYGETITLPPLSRIQRNYGRCANIDRLTEADKA